ncbi:WUSCHEL-related homeobox 11-like [Typha angustifolia]|uniref:WUSCHEL-related homeobox 11-like n=1 Tax=Typha angustifolia TaxID=59011 RepID=UPI003C2EEED6
MDQDKTNTNPSHGSANDRAPAEPARSRWTPKPEQILILESIFNSGMVNPPKDETVRIRKLLEKFGAVGDANVFYWFQNRRSRSRRRQRQMQAAASGGLQQVGGAIVYEGALSSSSSSNSSFNGGFFSSPSATTTTTTSSSSSSSSSATSCSSSRFVGEDSPDDLFAISRQMGFMDHASQFQYYQPATITVFINGVPSEVPRGPIDLRAIFGQDVMLVHSSGELLPVNEYGILMHSLQMGESYYLVSRAT